MAENSTILLAIILYFIVITSLSFLKTSYLPGRIFNLFRILFPSWRFFEEYTPVPILLYRVREKSGKFNPWKEGIPQNPRGWCSLIFNAKGNLTSAYHSLLDQILNDIQVIDEEDDPSHRKFESSTSYLLLKNLVQYQIKQDQKMKNHDKVEYQFKLVLKYPGVSVKTPSKEAEQGEVLLSPTYKLIK